MPEVGCALCQATEEATLWRDRLCRVLSVEDPAIPGFIRVATHGHTSEMTDLEERDRMQLVRVVFATEAIIRRQLGPDKVNLASLGNVVPHLHWHVIPRWRDDPWFPQPIWAAPTRPGTVPVARKEAAQAMRADFGRLMASALGGS